MIPPPDDPGSTPPTLPAARVLEIEPHQYHQLPSFSATLAKIATRQSVLHARDAWEQRAERLEEEDESDGDDDASDAKRKQLDNGNIKHALLLGKGKRIEIIPTAELGKGNRYSTDKAKSRRDAARKAGRIPVKECDWEAHERVAAIMRDRIAIAGHTLDGISELAIAFDETTPHGIVECRCMLDHVVLWGVDGARAPAVDPEGRHTPPGAIIYDLKIVGDAHPERVQRNAENLGYSIQPAAYTRGLTALYPELAGRVDFRFIFIEAKRPYALWDPYMSGSFREIGERRWRRAVNAWGEGLATGRWPAYRIPGNVEITAPMWTLKQEGYQPYDY